MKRVGTHAAELLEGFAQSIYHCNTYKGQYEHPDDEAQVKDLLKTASDLRAILGIEPRVKLENK